MSSVDPAEHQWNQWNCLNCKRRKVRCDRHYPCANCVKGQRDCIFPTSGRVFRRAESRIDPSRPRAKQAELMSRIRRLENVVDGLNTELESRSVPSGRSTPRSSPSHGLVSDTNSSHGVAAALSNPDVPIQNHSIPSLGLSPDPDLQPEPFRGPLQVAPPEERGSIYVGDHFWASLRREIKLIREAFDDLDDDNADLGSMCEPSVLPSSRGAFASNPCFVFGNSRDRNGNTNKENLDELRPLPAEMFFIWQSFVEIVSPFVHILHVPTVAKAIHGCRGRINTLDPSMEPLMFAISMATVNSLTDEEVRVAFDRDRDEFMAQLRLGTEKALSQADLLNTTSLPVVQAFILYLFTLRRCESARYIWCLVGLLVRIAVSIGLHRDGSHFPTMSPFEVEMRRRIWWNICCTEVRLGDGQVPEMCISERNFDTREPTNVNDTDIDPGMRTAPTPREGFTDTTITLIGCEKWRLTRTLQSVTSKLSSGQSEPDASIEETLEKLHGFKDRMAAERYHWQLDQPIQLALATLAKVHANRWELMIHHHHKRPPHPREEEPGPDDRSFALALAVVEDLSAFQQNKATRRWAWLVQGNVHWQPLAIVLTRVCSRPWDVAAEHVWDLVTRFLGVVPGVAQSDPLWRALCQLVTRAYRHRAQQLEQRDRSSQEWRDEPRPELTQGHAVRTAAVPDGLPRRLSRMDGLSLEGSPTVAVDLLGYQEHPAEGLPRWVVTGGVDESYETAGPMGDIVDGLIHSMDWGDWNGIFSM